MKKNDSLIILCLFIFSLFICVSVRADKERHGGFEYENSTKLLEMALSELYSEIRLADESAFPSFHQDWNKEKLADLIHTTRFAYDEETTGINVHDHPEKRMFDYVQEGNTFFIRALESYFDHYAGTPIDLTGLSFQEVLRDVKIKLIHEASHVVWEFNEFEADFYSRIIMQKLETTPQNKKESILKSMLEYLRQQFILAHSPSLLELQLDKKWTCWEYNVESPDLFEGGKKHYVFSEAAGLVMNFSSTTPQNYDYSSQYKAAISKRQESDTTWIEYVRHTSDGFLIVELTRRTEGCRDLTLREYVPATLTPAEELSAYYVCHIK